MSRQLSRCPVLLSAPAAMLPVGLRAARPAGGRRSRPGASQEDGGELQAKCVCVGGRRRRISKASAPAGPDSPALEGMDGGPTEPSVRWEGRKARYCCPPPVQPLGTPDPLPGARPGPASPRGPGEGGAGGARRGGGAPRRIPAPRLPPRGARRVLQPRAARPALRGGGRDSARGREMGAGGGAREIARALPLVWLPSRVWETRSEIPGAMSRSIFEGSSVEQEQEPAPPPRLQPLPGSPRLPPNHPREERGRCDGCRGVPESEAAEPNESV